jgi:hypothetical protein
MRGSGHHPGGGKRSLGDKIRAEVDSALRLLFKDVPQRAVSVDVAGNMVSYQMGFGCEVVPAPLETPEIGVSDDPVSRLKRASAAQSFALLPAEAPLSDNYPCTMTPALCHEPVLDALQPQWVSIHFESVSSVESRAWAVDGLETRAHSQTAETFIKPSSKALKPLDLQAAAHALEDSLPPLRTVNDPRFYALPIKKSPIPPNRFSASVRSAFRKALAEKARTHPNNVQLRIVYERMDMTLFAGIQQDEQGNLLCTPKNELIGRNQERYKGKQSPSPMYLVYGFRLDNKEDIRALVPTAEAVPEQSTSS